MTQDVAPVPIRGPPPGATMKRATSMLFDVLGRELDATEAQDLLNQATQRVINNQKNKSSPQLVKTAGPVASNPSSGADDLGSTHLTSNSSDSPSTLTQSSDASSQQPAQRAQAAPGGASQAQPTLVSSVVDLEADRAALAQHLTQFTPEVIFVELLGSLFIHPNRLQWEGLLGQGAYATVHRATLLPAGDEEGLNQAVAVKQLKPEVLASTSDLKDFLLEVNILRKMKHPNIVAIRGIGASDLTSLTAARASMYVVMEALEGGTLRDLVTRQMTSGSLVYESKHALRWGKHVAAAMHYLHAVCRPMIIHRDMKLENVLLCDGAMDARVAKLADFGLHKRARYNTATGTLTPAASINTVMAASLVPGGAFSLEEDKSYYGGTLYNPNNASVHYAPSVHPGKPGGYNSSMHGGSSHRPGMTGASVHGGSVHGGRLGLGASGGSVQGGRLGVSAHGPSVLGRSPSASANNSAHNSTGYVMTALQMQMSGLNNSTGAAQPGGLHKVASLKELVDLAVAGNGGSPSAAAAAAHSEAAGSGSVAPFGRDSLKGIKAPGGTEQGGEVEVPFGRDSLKGVKPQVEEYQDISAHSDKPVHGGASALDVLRMTPQSSLQTTPDVMAALQGAAAVATAPAPVAASLPGVATLLTDPAQASNLQHLHALLADEHPSAEGDCYAGGAAANPSIRTMGNPSIANPSFRATADASNPSVPAPVGGRDPETDRLQRDASVHRKMLALMALDAQGPYCVRPEGEFCPMPGPTERSMGGPDMEAPGGGGTGLYGGGMKAIPEHERSSLDISVGGQSARVSRDTSHSHHVSASVHGVSIPEGQQVRRLESSKHGGMKSFRLGALTSTGIEGQSFRKGQAYFAEATQQVGSLMYMAPELLNGGQYNHKVDVFSFGIMLYELFVGKLIACKGELMVGGEEEVMAYVKRRAQGERERLPSKWPQPLKDLVSDCWAQNPAARPTFEQVVNRLEAMEASGVLSTMVPSVHVRAPGDSGGCCVVM